MFVGIWGRGRIYIYANIYNNIRKWFLHNNLLINSSKTSLNCPLSNVDVPDIMVTI